MKLTSEMREYARRAYGPAARDFLRAVESIDVNVTGVHGFAAEAGEDVGLPMVLRFLSAGVQVLVGDRFEDGADDVWDADVERSGWLLIALRVAAREGWLPAKQ